MNDDWPDAAKYAFFNEGRPLPPPRYDTQMDPERFRIMFMPDVRELQDYQAEALQYFCDAWNDSTLWHGGRQSGRSTLRRALLMFLEWSEAWEREAGGPPIDLESLNAATALQAFQDGAPLSRSFTRDPILYQLRMMFDRRDEERRLPRVRIDDIFGPRRPRL